jgi:hypothetical protein
MTTRIEIKNEGPSDITIESRADGVPSAFVRVLKPKETESMLYVYHNQEIIVREKLES